MKHRSRIHFPRFLTSCLLHKSCREDDKVSDASLPTSSPGGPTLRRTVPRRAQGRRAASLARRCFRIVGSQPHGRVAAMPDTARRAAVSEGAGSPCAPTGGLAGKRSAGELAAEDTVGAHKGLTPIGGCPRLQDRRGEGPLRPRLLRRSGPSPRRPVHAGLPCRITHAPCAGAATRQRRRSRHRDARARRLCSSLL